jgi:hypothetical protein
MAFSGYMKRMMMFENRGPINKGSTTKVGKVKIPGRGRAGEVGRQRGYIPKGEIEIMGGDVVVVATLTYRWQHIRGIYR